MHSLVFVEQRMISSVRVDCVIVEHTHIVFVVGCSLPLKSPVCMHINRICGPLFHCWGMHLLQRTNASSDIAAVGANKLGPMRGGTATGALYAARDVTVPVQDLVSAWKETLGFCCGTV